MKKLIDFLQKIPQFVWVVIALGAFLLLQATIFSSQGGVSYSDIVKYQNKIIEHQRASEEARRKEYKTLRDSMAADRKQLVKKLDKMREDNAKTDVEFRENLQELKKINYEASKKHIDYRDSTHSSLLDKLRTN